METHPFIMYNLICKVRLSRMMEVEVNFDRDMEISVIAANGETYSYRVSDVLEIDENDLMDEFSKQSGTYAWWGAILENEKHALDEAKDRLRQVESEADEDVRKRLSNEGTKVTESIVSRKIPGELKYQSAQAMVNKRRRNVGVLNKVVEALHQRKDLLMMMGSAQKRDYSASGDLRTKSDVKSNLSVEELKDLVRQKNTQ